jgi:hypothetical protein|tara:strand:+ start:4143 stop:5543 length:1401 start_codon:yes stop_codon:yes gene_type:complete
MNLSEIEQEEQQNQYADNNQYKPVVDYLQQTLPDGKFIQQAASGAKKIRSIRVQAINPEELKQAMTKQGFNPVAADQDQMTSSGKYPVYSFERDGVLYTAVIGSVQTSTGQRAIGRKELSPAGLGISGGFYSKDKLINITRVAVEKKYRQRDPLLADSLIALLASAAGGGNVPLPKELMDHIQEYLGTVSQDFGEILAPILVMKTGQEAELPNGNYPLVDVKLPGMNLSIKSLTGSGTSFRSIVDLMDQYEESISSDRDKLKKFAVLKQFHPSTGGDNKDKILRAVAKSNIPEYRTLLKILGIKKITSFKELEQAVATKTGSVDYSEFLMTYYPIMIAGGWGKPVGLPADGAYYLGYKKDAPKKTKTAGKASYDSAPAKAGADILTYVLGIGLKNYIQMGSESKEYKDMMTDIVNKADAVIGHITINTDGTQSLRTEPFSNLKFNFHYRAPSHIPGNNLPGFMAIL